MTYPCQTSIQNTNETNYCVNMNSLWQAMPILLNPLNGPHYCVKRMGPFKVKQVYLMLSLYTNIPVVNTRRDTYVTKKDGAKYVTLQVLN